MIRSVAATAFVLIVLLSSTAPLLFGSRYAFRDVNHFYLPLYDYIGQRNDGQWLPLWNPLDHLGMPLVGETSTAVLYPVRFAVYRLPLSPEAAINGYLVFHLLLAAATAGWMARQIGCRSLGVYAAALLYPLSGSVFSLLTNPPFLVGAAWLPLVLGLALAHPLGHARPQSVWRRVAFAGIALTMMVLGGDPQTALHGVLVIAAISVARWTAASWKSRRPNAGSRRKEQDVAPRRLAGRSLLVAGGGGLVALSIAAVQVAASYDWSRQSDRVINAEQRGDLYDFSLGPWHAVELVSPRPFGHPFPVNRWLAELIPAEGRMWTPSIYAGLVVGFALLCRLIRPQRYFAEPWFAVAVVSLMLSFGHFGAVWWLQQLPGLLPTQDSAIGGPFWLLCKLLPGYESFRYPVKWLPVFSIAGTMVTARWLSSDSDRSERRLGLTLALGFALAAAVAHYLSVVQPTDRTFFGDPLPVDEYWGPLDAARGFALSRASWLLSLLVLIAVVFLRSMPRGEPRKHRRRVAAAWLLLIAADAGINAYHLLPTIDIVKERRLAHQASPPPISGSRTLRTQAGSWPDRWRGSQSPDRALEVAASERIAWFGRWHLAEQQAVFNSMVSIRSDRYAAFWQWAGERMESTDAASRNRFWSTAGQWLGIDSVSHVDETLATAADGYSLVHVDRRVVRPVPPVRVVSRWKSIAPLPMILADLVRTGEVPPPHVPFSPQMSLPQTPATPPERPRWEQVDADTFWIECDQPCVVERPVLQDGNWSAELLAQGRRAEYVAAVVPSSHLNQAVWIPDAGRWRVRFVYRPAWLRPALAISLFGWLVCGTLIVASVWRPGRSLRCWPRVR